MFNWIEVKISKTLDYPNVIKYNLKFHFEMVNWICVENIVETTGDEHWNKQ